MFEFLSKMGNNELGLDCISLIFNRPVHEYCTCLDGVLLLVFMPSIYTPHGAELSHPTPPPGHSSLSLSLCLCY